MSGKQIRAEVFPLSCQQAISRRLVKLARYAYLDRRIVQDGRGRDISVYLTTPKALNEVKARYPHRITSDLCKSDSVDHDLALVDIRRRLEAIDCVKHYFTENVLQACAEFVESERIGPFVRNHTDAVLEFDKSGQKIIAGLEFENSEKASERYTRKLLSYYSDSRIPIVLYVCADERIRKTVAQAESGVLGTNRPRCFYALSVDVLGSSESCAFVNLKGEKITLR
jgi:hypothetical protein